MRTVDYIRQLHAKQSFKIKDEFKFIEFDDVTSENITEDSPVPDQVEIWAAVEVYYTGEVPESYKALNLIIGDWVEDNAEELNDAVVIELKKHFEEHYPASDYSELDDGEMLVWLDQLDYMPRINPDDKSMIIEVELVMDTEHIEEGE